MNAFYRIHFLLAFVLFLGRVGSSDAQGNISIAVSQPASGALVGDALLVAVSINSTFELQLVTATVETRTTNLLSSGVGWTNTVFLAGLARGQKTLTVMASDVFGNSNQVQRTFIYDLPPTLTVLE